MKTPFSPRSEDKSISAIINRAITAGFSLAIVGMVGVMTFAQYVDTLSI